MVNYSLPEPIEKYRQYYNRSLLSGLESIQEIIKTMYAIGFTSKEKRACYRLIKDIAHDCEQNI
jgi:hypothetical protein